MSYVQIVGTELTSTGDEVAKHTPGSRVVIDNCEYIYVKYDNGTAVASAAGLEAFWKDASTFTVTCDYSDAGSVLNLVAGIMLAIVTDGYYAWMQVRGLKTVVANGDGDIAAGDILIAGAADTGVNCIAAGSNITNRIVGVAVAADNSTGLTVSAYLTLW